MALLVGINTKTTCRVSSVLNRDRKLYGPQFMFDGTDVTCWNSDPGRPQQIWLDFHRRVNIRQIQLMFQGGFVGEDVQFLVATASSSEFTPLPITVYFDDSNELQSVDMAWTNVTQVKIYFGKSTDFYGRVTIYQLNVLGDEIE